MIRRRSICALVFVTVIAGLQLRAGVADDDCTMIRRRSTCARVGVSMTRRRLIGVTVIAGLQLRAGVSVKTTRPVICAQVLG